jgi:hypothetical protein
MLARVDADMFVASGRGAPFAALAAGNYALCEEARVEWAEFGSKMTILCTHHTLYHCLMLLSSCPSRLPCRSNFILLYQSLSWCTSCMTCTSIFDRGWLNGIWYGSTRATSRYTMLALHGQSARGHLQLHVNKQPAVRSCSHTHKA